MLYAIDWLTLTIYNPEITTQELHDNRYYTFVEIENKARLYRHTYEVYTTDNVLFAILLFENKTNKTHNLKIVNKFLYSDNYNTVILDLLQKLNIKQYKISELHICIDSHINFVKRFNMKDLSIYEKGYVNTKYRKETNYYGSYFDRLFSPESYRLDETIYISNKKNVKSMCFYNKSKE